jgi:CubicO group peptidase (beta-lactamase class C family)
MIESGVGFAGKLGSPPEYYLSWGRSKKESLFYDLASLTKIILTNSLLLELMLEQKKTLTEFRLLEVGSILKTAPEFIQKMTIASLWDHCSGLKAHFYLDPLKSRSSFKGDRSALWSYVLKQIESEMGAPAETNSAECVYSDLNFWVLGAVLETYYQKDLRSLWQDFKKKHSLAANDLVLGPVKNNAIPTEKRHQSGVVNDDNAVFMQEIAPHAGLFSTIEAVWEWLNLMNTWVSRKELEPYFTPQTKGRFWCGWDRPSSEKTLAGEGADKAVVLGHLGFTGTALWWNPLTKWGGILLTNRVFPSADQNQTEIRDLRIKFFTLLWHNNRKELWKALQETVEQHPQIIT